jgi:hypothetical protein
MKAESEGQPIARQMPEAVGYYAQAVRLAPGSRPYRLLLAAAQQERAYRGGTAGVPPAVARSTHAQPAPLLPPAPVASALIPGSPPPAGVQAVPAGAVSVLPWPLNAQPSTLNQAPDPNPLLKIRQQ